MGDMSNMPEAGLDELEVAEKAAGLNEWESKMLHTAAHDGVLAACRQAYADGMQWARDEPEGRRR